MTAPRGFRAIRFEFRLEAYDAGLQAHLEEVLAGLAVTEVTAASRYRLVDRGMGADWRYALLRDDHVLKRAHRPAPLLGKLVHDVNSQAVASAADRTVLHAAAAQRGDHTLVLAGAMDAGKSTLVAALVKDGFRYLTDEAVALSAQDSTFPPFAKPIGLEGPARAIHSDLEPRPHPLVAEWAERIWLVPPAAFRRDAVGRTGRPTIVVVTRYDPEAGTALRPISRATMVQRLVPLTFGFHEDGRRHLGVLARMVRGAACFTMTVDDLDRACRLLRGVTDETGSCPPAGISGAGPVPPTAPGGSGLRAEGGESGQACQSPS